MKLLKYLNKTYKSDKAFGQVLTETAARNALYAERGENQISPNLKLTIDTDNLWDKFLRVRRRDESS